MNHVADGSRNAKHSDNRLDALATKVTMKIVLGSSEDSDYKGSIHVIVSGGREWSQGQQTVTLIQEPSVRSKRNGRQLAMLSLKY